jgi:DNA (cytosine-5)-methyltransferase 1
VSHRTDPSSGLKYASVCDGIGAAHVAWQPLGWQCQWTSEIEPFPAAVVEHHYGFRNLGDMTAITEEMLDEPVDLLVGGTPCQSFSVAGLRGGLADPRGNLALRFVQLAAVMQPKWIVWENVPGVLSSCKGRDFGTFLGALGELGYGFAYRVLDAQWFGVAQRRRRVFVVGYLGDWRRAAAVLFERESVFGNPPTRGKAWEGVARPTAASPGVCGPLTAGLGRGVRGTETTDSHHAVVAFHHNAQAAQLPHTGRDTSITDSLTCSQGAAVAFTGDKTHALAARADSSEDGTGRGTPIVATPFTKSKRAQSTTDDETWVPGEVSPTMSCFDQGDTRATTVVAQGFTYSGYSNKPAWMTGDRTDCLPASGHSDGSHQGVGVATAMAVRRLTPGECERLQGFPDDYTLVAYRNKPAADGPRYRALGNSMAVPVMRWIGERIAKVDTLKNQGAA